MTREPLVKQENFLKSVPTCITFGEKDQGWQRKLNKDVKISLNPANPYTIWGQQLEIALPPQALALLSTGVIGKKASGRILSICRRGDRLWHS